MIETFMHSMGTIVSRNEDHIIWNERFLQFSSVLLCAQCEWEDLITVLFMVLQILYIDVKQLLNIHK